MKTRNYIGAHPTMSKSANPFILDLGNLMGGACAFITGAGDAVSDGLNDRMRHSILMHNFADACNREGCGKSQCIGFPLVMESVEERCERIASAVIQKFNSHN